MDLYDENEQVISSDEYSDDDDDDEALMNDAIRARDDLYERSHDFNHRNKQSIFDINQKQKVLSSLIRKNKISIIYKNKSIKWLNSKKQRERYKELIHQNKGKNKLSKENVTEDSKKTMNVEIGLTLVNTPVSIGESDNEMPAIANADLKEKTNVKLQEIADAKENAEIEETVRGFKKENLFPEKRARSLTPKICNESSEVSVKQNEKKSRIKSPQFYKSINDMFPKFNNIATEHINTITKNTLTSVEEKMKSLTNEINTLSEILNTKEMEWNRLLHLKTVKEEIYSRLRQKRQNLLTENYSKMESQRNLEDLKELEFYLSANKAVSPGVSFSTITIQKLIEKRANMNAEDLEREKSNTSRLHSLLVSNNMLHGKNSSENVLCISNGKRANSFPMSKTKEEAIVSKISKQGEFKDPKNIMADFRQKNAEILSPAQNQINLSNSELEQHNISIPAQGKKFSSSLLQIRRHSESFPHGNTLDEISVSPITRFKKLSSKYDNDSISTVNNHFNIVSDDNYLKNRGKTDGNLITNINYPLCQECKTNESRFVCAGCGNQWYCSKKCQVSAWEKHSDLCTE